jgi:hypothetical protein
MLQKGRGKQEIEYKKEVLNTYPSAKWVCIKQGSFNMGAIMVDNKRISHPYKIAYKAWESAYYIIKTNSFDELYNY